MNVFLIFKIIGVILGGIAVVAGFNAYIISLRTNIRLKYHRFIGQSGVEKMIQEEYEHTLIWTLVILIVFTLLASALAYFVVLCLRNNIPLI